MCGIASLFLLQRQKGSMSGNARYFNNVETWAVIKFFFLLQGKAPKEIHAILTEILGEYAPSYAIIKNWVAQFKRGDFSTCDAPRPRRPETLTTPEIHELILEDRWISAKSIAEQLGISCERVGGPSFMKIWTCGISPRSGSPNAWTRIKNVNGASHLSKFWNFSASTIQMNSCRARLVTMDKTWLYHYDPETKQQSMELRHSGSSRPKIFRVKKSAGKVLA